MPELILFSFIALLIGGMLWSDRDSRRWRFGEPFPPYSAALETLIEFKHFQQCDEMLIYRSAIVQAQFNAFIGANQVAILPTVTYTESEEK